MQILCFGGGGGCEGRPPAKSVPSSVFASFPFLLCLRGMKHLFPRRSTLLTCTMEERGLPAITKTPPSPPYCLPHASFAHLMPRGAGYVRRHERRRSIKRTDRIQSLLAEGADSTKGWKDQHRGLAAPGLLLNFLTVDTEPRKMILLARMQHTKLINSMKYSKQILFIFIRRGRGWGWKEVKN